jgi:hypothetical protein
MAHVKRNQSDLPLTIGEATEFLSPEEDSSVKTGSKSLSNEDRVTPPREQWGSKFEFIFSCMAFSIGLGNVSFDPIVFHRFSKRQTCLQGRLVLPKKNVSCTQKYYINSTREAERRQSMSMHLP